MTLELFHFEGKETKGQVKKRFPIRTYPCRKEPDRRQKEVIELPHHVKLCWFQCVSQSVNQFLGLLVLKNDWHHNYFTIPEMAKNAEVISH